MSELYMRHLLCAALALGLGLHAGVARADDPFVDSRLTVTLGDDDFFTDAGERIPDSPRLGFGDRSGYELPYDNLNTRFSGRESLAHLVFYRKLPAFFRHVTTAAAIVLRAGLDGGEAELRDTGSYLQVVYNPWFEEQDGLTLTLFPFSTDRVRLGHLYDLSVGGDDFFPRRSHTTPGFKLQLDRGALHLWGAFKAVLSATAPEETTNEQGTTESTTRMEVLYSGLGGVGLDLFADRLRLELGGGYFQQAENQVADVAGEMVTAVGLSGRLVWHQGLPVEESIDFALYRNDPNAPFRLFALPVYHPGQLGLMLSLEGISEVQTLADPDVYGKTKRQWGSAGALRARVQPGYLRLELTALVCELAFCQAGSPGFESYTAFGDEAQTDPEWLLAAAADYHLADWHLTLGLSAGLYWPAAVKTEIFGTVVGANAPPTLIGEHTLLVGRSGERVILPEGTERKAELYGRAQARLDLSELVSAMVWLQYGYHSNDTVLTVNADLSKSRVLRDPHSLGAGLSAALRL